MLDYVLDENGNILKIEGDGQGTALSCTIAYELESGKRYYFLAKSRDGSSGLKTISYEGLKVTLDFESGKSVTYTYGDDDFWSLFRIIPDIEYSAGHYWRASSGSGQGSQRTGSSKRIRSA